jgi:hypothetical protein
MDRICDEEKYLSEYIEDLEDLDIDLIAEQIDGDECKIPYANIIRREAARRVRAGWELRTDNRKPAGQSTPKPQTSVSKPTPTKGPKKPSSVHGDPPYQAPPGQSWMFVDETKPKKPK